MKTKLCALILGILFTMPRVANADEVVILLQEVIGMTQLPGESPLDKPDKEPVEPTRPTSFHATIDGHFLSITKQDTNIPSAQVSVVNASNGGLVLNQLMTDSMEETISNNGVYVLRIATAGGDLVGQFIVE